MKETPNLSFFFLILNINIIRILARLVFGDVKRHAFSEKVTIILTIHSYILLYLFTTFVETCHILNIRLWTFGKQNGRLQTNSMSK